MKKILTLATATLLAMSMCIPTFAYQRLNTTDNTKNWRWEDWDDDGVYECYYYKDNGNRGFNLGTTPDGYELNQAGQWIVNGVVQTRTKEETTSTTESSRSADYDPAHPLAGKIEMCIRDRSEVLEMERNNELLAFVILKEIAKDKTDVELYLINIQMCIRDRVIYREVKRELKL